MIVSLAAFFAQHLLWSNVIFANVTDLNDALVASIDAASGIAILIAMVLLFKFKLSVIKLIAVFAVAGLLYQFFK